MATNRTRKKRIPKSKIPTKISETYRQKLKFKDFCGTLEPDEISIAKKAGVLRWDLWKKAGKVVNLTGAQYRKGVRVAPVFNSSGKPDTARYPKDKKFLIENYAELKEKTA